jgi:hypothetical protein
MLKTVPALSLGLLLAGAAASNAGQPSRTLMHKLHAHRAAHYRTVGLRAREGAPVIGSELKMGLPLGATSLWFKDRINRNGGRRRKTTIVALARKLLVALWKYVSAGVVIEGAMIRPA